MSYGVIISDGLLSVVRTFCEAQDILFSYHRLNSNGTYRVLFRSEWDSKLVSRLVNQVSQQNQAA